MTSLAVGRRAGALDACALFADVVVWLTVESLGLTGEAVRLQGQPPQC